MRMLVVFGSLLALLLAVGCGGSDTGEQEQQQEATEIAHEVEDSVAVLVVAHTVTEEEIGQEFTCPVSGMEMTVADTTPAAEYDGVVYYFYTEDEMTQFTEDPDQFLMVVDEMDHEEVLEDAHEGH